MADWPDCRPETPGARITGAALLDAKQVAATLAVSVRHVRRLADGGDLPRPVRLGKLIRWRRQEIERWIAAGCPRSESEGRQ